VMATRWGWEAGSAGGEEEEAGNRARRAAVGRAAAGAVRGMAAVAIYCAAAEEGTAPLLAMAVEHAVSTGEVQRRATVGEGVAAES